MPRIEPVLIAAKAQLKVKVPVGTDEQTLSSADIENGLNTRRLGRSVLCFDTVDSTNDIAWDSARSGNPDGLVVTAEHQTAGRGRFGRTWHSRRGEGLLFSIFIGEAVGDTLPSDALVLAAGVSVADAVDALLGVELELKWPNDLLADGRKAGGILAERKSGIAGIVVGAGMNVNGVPAVEDTAFPPVSLRALSGTDVSRAALLKTILRELDGWVTRLPGDGEALHRAWLNRCGMIHQRVIVNCRGAQYTGRMIDVDPFEGLDLVDDTGTRVHLPAMWSTITGIPDRGMST